MNEKKIKNPPHITINYAWCKKCEICISFCPTGVFTADEFGAPIIAHPEKCISCQFCVMSCPEFAVKLKERKKEE